MTQDLTMSQKAILAARMADMPHRRPKFEEYGQYITISKAAAHFNVSPRQVGIAKKLLREGTSDVIAQVEAGVLTLYAALPRYYDKYFKRQR
jgi:hypothetical protein